MLVGQLIFDGLAMGLVFVILATGLVLLSSVNRILFMAYGMFYTIGAYLIWYIIYTWNLSYFIALPIGILIVGLLGVVCYLLIFQRLQQIAGGFLATLIASLGLLLILSQGDLLVFGTVERSIPPVFRGNVILFGINMPVAKLVLIGAGVIVTLFLFWVYEKTKIGRAMRTVAFLPEVAPLLGISTNRVYLITMGVSTALAGIAGGILAPTYGLNPAMGNNILWTVMLMCMLGGMDSLLGAVVGGVVIGQLLSFGQFYLGSVVQIIIFIIIGVILYYRPNGLLGRGINIGI